MIVGNDEGKLVTFLNIQCSVQYYNSSYSIILSTKSGLTTIASTLLEQYFCEDAKFY